MLPFLAVMTIAAATLLYVFWPLRGEDPGAGADPQLLVERERIALAKDRKIDEIRELRGDREAGKLEASGARDLERRLRAEAADLLHQLDELDAQLAAAAGEPLTPDASAPAPKPLP